MIKIHPNDKSYWKGLLFILGDKRIKEIKERKHFKLNFFFFTIFVDFRDWYYVYEKGEKMEYWLCENELDCVNGRQIEKINKMKHLFTFEFTRHVHNNKFWIGLIFGLILGILWR
jgi:hypothetical protein